MKTKKIIKPKYIKIIIKKDKGTLKIKIDEEEETSVDIKRRPCNKMIGKALKKGYIETENILGKGEKEIKLHPEKIELKTWKDTITLVMGKLSGDSIHILLNQDNFKKLTTKLVENGHISEVNQT